MSDEQNMPQHVREVVADLLESDDETLAEVEQACDALLEGLNEWAVDDWLDGSPPPEMRAHVADLLESDTEALVELGQEFEALLDHVENGVAESGHADAQPSRVRTWVQNFLDVEDNQTMVDVGRNFVYLLDHVDEWESGDLSYTDLPALEVTDRWLMGSSAAFGTYWPVGTSTLYAVADAEGRFIGLYGHEENATARADDEDGTTVEACTPTGPSPREYVERFLSAEGEAVQVLGETFEFLLDNREAFESGEMLPDEFPHFDQNTKWLIGYSVLFGMLWELSHPSLHAVFDGDHQLIDVFWDPDEAEARAATLGGNHYTQRQSVVDGDVPPDVVLGAIGPGSDTASTD